MKAALLTLLLFAGCTAPVDGTVNPLYGNVEAEVDAMLYGSDRPCDNDATCGGARCRMGRCIGLLFTNERWLQKRLARAIGDRARSKPELKDHLLERLKKGLSADTFMARRGRAIPLLEDLGERQLLLDLAKSSAEPLAIEAKLALCRLAEPDVLPDCVAFTESDNMAVAVEAIKTLGQSGDPKALATILRTLNADLDRALVWATLDAVESLGDARGIRPLVAFLDECPAFMRRRTVMVLRGLSGAKLGGQDLEWRGWVETNKPPAPPQFRLREASSVEILGIPEP